MMIIEKNSVNGWVKNTKDKQYKINGINGG